MHSAALAAVALTVLALAGCATPISGTPAAPANEVAAVRATQAATDGTRRGCVSFEAHGGALYNVFVVPFLGGQTGQKSISVDADQLVQATALMAEMSPSDFEGVPDKLRDAAGRLGTAAESFSVYDHAEGTALLTAFTDLAVNCTKAGFQPSWFKPSALISS